VNTRVHIQKRPMPMMIALTAAIALVLHGTSPASAQTVPMTPDGTDKAATQQAPDSGAGEAPDGANAAGETSTPNTLTTISVTGSFRDSLGKAIDIKRDTLGQTDTILAEDIGKFPDLNLAESLQRIPGISIARDAGEGRQISVRGLGPDFTRVRINGMEALTTTGGTDSSGGANRGRGFDFNIFASELFNRITVNKTAAAELEEGSLGATVDLQTARPFDYGKFTAVASAQGSFNDLSDTTDPRAAAMISNVFADGTFGALFSAAYTKRRLIEEGHSTVRWDPSTASGGFNPDSPYTPALSSDVFHPRIPRYGVLTHDQDRLGLTGSLQWQATDHTLFTLDALYADINATRSEDFLEALSFSRTGSSGKPETIVRDGAIDANGNLVYGVFDNVDVRSEARYDELETKFTQISLSGEHDITDTLHLSGGIGHSRSAFDNPIQTTITVDHLNTQNFIWDYRDNSRLPLISYGYDVNNPAQWNFGAGSDIRLRPQTVDNMFTNRHLDLGWDITDNFTLKGGIFSKDYKFTSTEMRRASETNVPNLPDGINIADLLRPVSLSDLGVPAGTDTTWLAPNFNAFANLFDIYSNTGIFALSSSQSSARGNNRTVKEEDSGGWLQGDFRASLGSMPIRGNFGVRYVKTDQKSSGFAIANGVPVLTTVDRSYNDALPSFNLVAEVTDDFLIRFGAAKVMARPGLGNLSPGVTVSVSGGSRTVKGGNPNLDPFRAKTADLGFEWYFAEDSLLSLALFWKDIDSFVQTSRETRPYNTSGLPVSLLAGTGASPDDDFEFSIPINTPGGKLKGFEISYQQPFSFLPGIWSKFGSILNYTYVDSKIQYVTSSGANSLNTDLTGLSKNAYNATLYFENDHFSARVSAAYRDNYLTTVPGRNGADVEGTKASTNIDASASWKFNEHFELTFEGINLTDEFSDQYVDSVGDRVSVYHHVGRTFMVGIRIRN
jgi:iron complex outermembrane recepter protein